MMRGLFIDIQGTLIDDKNFLPLKGSVEFLKTLKAGNIPYVLVTNNTKRKSGEFIKYLHTLGFEFENYIDPLMVLEKTLKSKNVAAYGSMGFIKALEEKGYVLDYKTPKSVVLGIKLYSNEELSEILEFVLNGAQLVGMHKTSIYSYKSKRYPGLGAVLEMLKYASGCEYITIGKPNKLFFDTALGLLNLNYDKITIISDDLKGDLLPAKKLGMKTVLVLSGKIKSKEEIKSYPDEIYDNLEELMKEWKKNCLNLEKK